MRQWISRRWINLIETEYFGFKYGNVKIAVSIVFW